jgi:membrane associated rhomboid family serine protease
VTDREEDFIETLVRWGSGLGLNPVRLRWRLRRLADDFRRWRGSLASDNARGYQHRVCGNCGSLQDRSARVCTQCGEKLGARSVERMHRLGFAAPRLSLSAGLGLLITLAYFRLILDARELGFGVVFTMDPHVLWVHGSWHMGAFLAGQYWRIVTALFLHIGMWHAGFNLLALATVGPAIEDLYGRGVTLFLFLLTGAIANLVSGFMSPYGNAGASGALMGLIGLAAVRGHLMRSAHGRQVRDLMLSWFVYTILFGLLMHADNWAHLGGFVTGLGIGFVLEPRWLRHPVGRVVGAVLGGVGLVVTLGAMALVMWPPGA